jgi:N-hydroxyarylamine O-acetyltransferase
MVDVEAYLARIGLGGRPGLSEIHRAHATTIPFENLDSRRGIAVSLDPDDLQDKLVTRRRGGYCFEHNLLLAEMLNALGMTVELLLARVRMGTNPAAGIRPQTHLALRVTDDHGAVWHADVGFGLGTPLLPLPFGPGDEHDLDGWRFRVVAEGRSLVLQALESDQWADLYDFDPQPVPRIDCEVSNWFASTFPGHPMVRWLMVAANGPDGTRVLLSDASGELLLSEHTTGGWTVTPVATADAGALLERRFGLDAALLDE